MKKKLFAFLGVLFLTISVPSRSFAESYTMGVFPGAETTKTDIVPMMDTYLPLVRYLSRETGSAVKFVPVRIPKLALESMTQHNGYPLFFGPPVFAAQVIDKGFEPIVIENARIRGAFVVAEKSPLKKVEDITSATRIGMPPPPLLLAVEARATLAKRGIAPKPEFLRYTTAQDVLLAGVSSGTSDVAVLRDRQADVVLKKNPGKFRIIGYTVDAPGFALVASKKLPNGFRDKVQKAMFLLNGDNLDPLAQGAKQALHGDQLIAANNDDFVHLSEMMKKYSK